MARKTGARGLRSIVENALLETMYELPSMKNAKTVIVDEQVINEGKTPEIIFSTDDSEQIAIDA